jgi:hypothetical protein
MLDTGCSILDNHYGMILMGMAYHAPTSGITHPPSQILYYISRISNHASIIQHRGSSNENRAFPRSRDLRFAPTSIQYRESSIEYLIVLSKSPA